MTKVLVAALIWGATSPSIARAAVTETVEISYGSHTDACPSQSELHRAIGHPVPGLHVSLRFRRGGQGYEADLRVTGRLQGTRTLQATSCGALEGALVLNVKLLDRISRLTDAQERAEKVAAILDSNPYTVTDPLSTGTFAIEDREAEEVFATAPSKRRADRHWVNDLPIAVERERDERWSPNLDFIGLYGVLRNGALAVSGGVNWRVREHWRIAAAIIFAPPRSVDNPLLNVRALTTAMVGVSAGACRAIIRSWSISSLEACASLVSGAVHIASGSASAETPWFGIATEFVLDASMTRHLGARLRGGALIPFYNPSSSLTELAGAYESLRLGAVVGVGLVAHFE